MPADFSKSIARLCLGLFLLGAVVVSALGYTEKWVDYAGMNRLTRLNSRYLDASFKRSLGTFGVLSTLKAGLAVIEGSEVGVGFGLQVGDVVQAAYDYVHIAWMTVLAGGVILLGTRYVLQAAALADQWLLVMVFLSTFLMLVSRWLLPERLKTQRTLRDITLFLTVLTISFYVMLPLAVTGGAFLSKRITAPSIAAAETGLAELKQDLFPDDNAAETGLRAKLSHLKEQLDKVASYLSEKTGQMIIWVITLITGYLFDCVLFPLALLFFLLWFTKLAAQYLFGVRQNQSFKEDIQGILDLYFSKHHPVEENKAPHPHRLEQS